MIQSYWSDNMFSKEIDYILLTVGVTFLFTALIMPFMAKIAKHVNAIDEPRTRHIHKIPMPKLGGLGIFFGFLFGYMLFGVNSIQMNSVLIGSFIIIIVGIIDDIKPIKSMQKLLGQTVAALVIITYGNIVLSHATVFGLDIQFGIFKYPITLLFILGCVNIINLIDGLDGLSSGISSIFFITIGIISFFQGKLETLGAIITFIMLGATLGFLVHNFYPAKIFAGDCATFMGFIIGVITLLEFKGPALISFFVPVAILGIPILDTLFAIIRRLLKGQPPFKADKQHLHHQLLGMNFSQTVTVLIIYGINILFATATLIFVLKDPMVGQILFIIIFVLVAWFVFHTTIISDKNPERVKKLEEKIGIRKNNK